MSTPELHALPAALQWRPIVAADIEAWRRLILRMAAVDKPDWVEERADLEEVLCSSKNDPTQDTLVGYDGGGEPRAFGHVSLNPGSTIVHGSGGVDPGWRGEGIGRAVLRWQQDRARVRVRACSAFSDSAAAVLRIHVDERNLSHRALLDTAGAHVVRYFTEMTMALGACRPAMEVPDGFRLVGLDRAADRIEPMRQAHNEAFGDHWGSEPRDAESWAFALEHPQTRLDWCLALEEVSSGELVAYHVGSCSPDSKALVGYSEGYTDLLGVRTRWRGRGLAALLLTEAMHRFRQADMEHASLAVDTANPSGALGIYERLGYRSVRRTLAFDLTL